MNNNIYKLYSIINNMNKPITVQSLYWKRYSKRFGYAFSISLILLGLMMLMGQIFFGFVPIIIGVFVLMWHINRIKK